MLYVFLVSVDAVKEFTATELTVLALVDVVVTTLLGALGFLVLLEFWEAWFSYPLF